MKNFINIFSNIRIKIIKFLYTYGSLKFSEIQKLLSEKIAPSTLSYHLKFLLENGLILKSSRGYELTRLGMNIYRRLVEIESMLETGELLVRRHLREYEPFNRKKIVNALIREAGVPPSLADQIAIEAEEKLKKMPIELTSDLIREVVNALLAEKGLEDIRSKLLRLGLPIYDINQLIFSYRDRWETSAKIREKLVKPILEEFSVLRLLTKKVREAYIKGSLHIIGLDDWPLSYCDIVHDTLYLIHNAKFINLIPEFIKVSNEFDNKLISLLTNISLFSSEVYNGQMIYSLNFALAPFVKKLTFNELIKKFEHFITLINNLSINSINKGIMLEINLDKPKYYDEDFYYKGGIRVSDYIDEAYLIAKALEKAFSNIVKRNTFIPNLQLAIRLPEEVNSEVYDLVVKFSRICMKGVDVIWLYGKSAYTYTFKKAPNIPSILGTSITLNMPRAALRGRSIRNSLNELDKLIDISIDAILSKHRIFKRAERSGTQFYFSLMDYYGEPYINSKRIFYTIELIGLFEFIYLLTGFNYVSNKESLSLLKEIISHVKESINRASEKYDIRITISQSRNAEASFRFFKLDRQEYKRKILELNRIAKGVYYSLYTIPEWWYMNIEELLRLEGEVSKLFDNNYPVEIWLGDLRPRPEKLAKLILKYIKNIKALNFQFSFTFCNMCKNIIKGIVDICPFCGSRGRYIIHYSKIGYKYRPITSIFDQKITFLRVKRSEV